MAAIEPSLRQQAEQLAATLPPLLVAAERVAAVVAQGVHGRRRVGSGETFWQFRRYQPGDETSRIDWRQSAKSLRVFVRENEWEAAQSIWLWCDESASMRYRSRLAESEKLARARLMLLALAVLLVRGGELVALLGRDSRPAGARAALNRLSTALSRPRPPGSSLPPAETLPRYARLVLIGDFLSPLDDIHARVRKFAGDGVKGHLLQVLDPAEEMLPFGGRTRFEGLEGEGVLLVGRAESFRPAYLERLAAQHEGLAALARDAGWTFAVHRTDRPPQTALLALYMTLAARPGR
ncbi:MAG: DUF58 domain-containing protein [Alphaproteobacteria bacterium]